jgi:hypothetical protein
VKGFIVLSISAYGLNPKSLAYVVGGSIETFGPIFTSFSPSIGTFPSVLAMFTAFPLEDSQNSFDRSTLMVRMLPSTLISTFFMISPIGVMSCCLV